MDEDEPFPKRAYPLTPLMQERVERILLAIARRVWELRRDTAPAGSLPVQQQWQTEAVRSSPLGHHLMLIARYVDRSYFSPDQGQVESAMQHLLRQKPSPFALHRSVLALCHPHWDESLQRLLSNQVTRTRCSASALERLHTSERGNLITRSPEQADIKAQTKELYTR